MPDHAVRTRSASLALLAGGAGGAAYLWGTDPHEPGHLLPFCPFRRVTGLQCPACGATRITYDLLHGDLARAWQDNALLLLVAPLALVWLVRSLVDGLRGHRYAFHPPAWFTPVVLTTAVGWAVVRNVA
ncbi:MAG: DUF2752 domain-containing protein [Actinomycetota bacterium]|nr:DUF2752 domain-containing protein [Actinomycetota bacterium]